MKKILFFCVILILSSCNYQKYSQLKNENAQLKLRIDSLSNALSESIKIAETNKQIADSAGILAKEQKQIADTMRVIAEQRRYEAEKVRKAYQELLMQKEKNKK